MFRFLLIIAASVLMMQAIHGFVPHTPKPPRRSSCGNSKFLPANFVSAAAPTNALTPSAFLRMATDGDNDAESKISADGTFYDDEVGSLFFKNSKDPLETAKMSHSVLALYLT